MSGYLTVPLRVDALVVHEERGRPTLGPTSNWERVPWADGTREIGRAHV